MKEEKLNILFLCTGNACRSQIAQGWAEFLKPGSINAFSAGTNPAAVSRLAIKVMAESGVDISGHYSKHMDDLKGVEFDYVITLCDNANELCPRLPGKTKHIHKPFSDPSFMIGTEEVLLKEFRKVRNMIRDFVETLPQSLRQQRKGSD